MKYIKTYEGLFDYFSKESKDKRTKIKEIKDGLIKLINSYQLRIENNIRWIGVTPMKEGNTQLNTKYGKFKININDDFTVDVYGNVGIRFGNDVEILPCKFNKVIGNFFVELSYGVNNFFDKFPERVEGSLGIVNCGLDSLKDLSTKYVGNNFDCSSNNLQTFQGLPAHIGGDINADSNDIYTYEFLEGFKGGISLYLNPIQYVSFYDNNELHSLQELLVNDEYYDLFKSCDPIHPPLKKYGKPIIYINRIEVFANELDIKFQLRDSIKQYYDVR